MGYYDADWGQQINNAGTQAPSVPGPFGGTDSDMNGNALTQPAGPQELGGFNNPTTGPGIEQWQDQRLGMLGSAAPVAQLPSWMKNQQGQYQGWADQTAKMQQDEFAKAQAQFNGGDTAAQGQLRGSQQAQGAALGSMAHSATGGARGAAAAQGTASMLGGAMQGAQGNAMIRQKLADKYAAADLMSSIGNQQRGLAQGEYGVHATDEGNQASYEQGWNATNDQAALWSDTMQNNRQQADLGYQTQNAATANQNAQFYQGLANQYLGAGLSAAGSGLAAGGGLGGGGGGGYQNSYDGTIYQQSPY